MTNLPVESVLSEVAEALGAAGRAVLEAPPGSGKTTRVPLGLIEAGWLAGRRILMLEPRRLAARAAARYMASLLGEPVGETVGYRVRMDSRVGRHTRVEVVTEGVLTRLLQADPALEAYGLVIFDEFHQRSLQADLGLALCLQSRELLREDLRLLVMSATLDGDAVASFLDDAPVIRAQGRSYPVETRYLPPPANGDLLRHTAAATSRALAEEGGSVLVFLPGVAEIRRVTEWLKSNLPQDVILAPLYGDLSSEAQDQAIRPAPHGRRKVVLATAIAETSLTIEGVRIVIDAGRMRVSRFDPGSGMSRLVTLNVSRAAADQRRGRAGRSAPGVCWRLWSEGQTASLAPATTPEILEADLAPLALELARWGVSDPAELRWLDSPPAGSLAQARDLLVRLAALDRGGRLTAHGEALSELPLHPRLGHMLVRGIARGQGSEACWLAAMLSERDVLAKQAGPRPADMDLRLRHIKEARPRHVSQVAGKLAERLDVRLAPPSTRHTDELLMLAYPDRLAHRRPGSQPRYVLANGRGVRLPEDDALATAEWLAVAHLDGAQREGRIFLAAATSRSRIEDVFADEIEDCEVIEWDDTAEAVVARNERRLGALALQSRVQPHPDPDRTTELLLEAIRRKGLQVLPWTKSAKAWL
ncbi:MAG: ATP-dependent helicase HrpB, partial [Gammaproteobacteria bacterium]